MDTKRIVVTGGAGFLGHHLVKRLREKFSYVSVPYEPNGRTSWRGDSGYFDLTIMEDVKRLYAEEEPDIVIHLAAVVGGIGANMTHPGEFFYKNIMMGVQLIEEGRKANLKKFVAIGTVCAYPKMTPVPFKEDDLWNGYPEETNAPYGLAKKMLLVQAQAYRQQYGMNAIYLLPVNLYGPGDNFDPEKSHVIPALIRKFHDAVITGKDKVTIWGTGSASREFLYVEDAAEAIMLATELYNKPDPVNLGSGKEIEIKKLAETIAIHVGFQGRIVWDHSKPDGQPRRCLDVSRAEKEFGFKAKTTFDVGLKNTVDWYISSVYKTKDS
jgi:GDP-L-fucose synthase